MTTFQVYSPRFPGFSLEFGINFLIKTSLPCSSTCKAALQICREDGVKGPILPPIDSRGDERVEPFGDPPSEQCRPRLYRLKSFLSYKKKRKTHEVKKINVKF